MEKKVSHFKARLMAAGVALISAAMGFYNWQLALHKGHYYIKAAVLCPIGLVGGIFILLFPSLGGKPTTKQQRILFFTVYGTGVVLGLVNWFFMDPDFLSPLLFR